MLMSYSSSPLTEKSGLMVGITQQMIGVGFIVSTWIGYGSAHVPDSSPFSWRFPLAFQTVPCIIIIVGLTFFPESPRALIEWGREDEGLKVVRITLFPIDLVIDSSLAAKTPSEWP